jgi:hydrogenase/urease accessory protein HupE
MTRGWRAWLVVVALALTAGAATAHEISMAEMQLREVARGDFVWQWTAGGRSGDESLVPEWPSGGETAEGRVRCGEEGLSGNLEMRGVGDAFSAVVLKIHWLDGQSTVHTLTEAQPAVLLFGSADDRRSMLEIARAYTILGVEHILGGIDHLLFVLALLFLVGFGSRLLWTITAFTVAHSVTLALSALGLLTLRPPPVEATIALSIMLVAGEALHRQQTLSRRFPAVVAFLFGLVHGLGFAGALKAIGLPDNHLPVALLTFNLGVEAGQLAVIALAYACWKLLGARPMLAPARTAALYLIGTMAAYWSIQRVVEIFA